MTRAGALARTPRRTRSDAVRAGAAAATALGLLRLLSARPPGGGATWERTNHRGRSVSLLAGPALAVTAAATCALPRRAALCAGLGAGAVGLYDDLAGTQPGQRGSKGFRGHLAALRRGQLTSGAVKVAGISAAGLAAAALLPRRGRGAPGLLLDGALVAGSANLLNLLDLRPGRALKVGLLLSLGLGEAGGAGASAALLPYDLAERTMVGDTGANALGALLGLAAAHRLPGAARAGVLTGVVALTAASEVVSFSAVIERTPLLRALDALGRRP